MFERLKSIFKADRALHRELPLFNKISIIVFYIFVLGRKKPSATFWWQEVLQFFCFYQFNTCKNVKKIQRKHCEILTHQKYLAMKLIIGKQEIVKLLLTIYSGRHFSFNCELIQVILSKQRQNWFI